MIGLLTLMLAMAPDPAAAPAAAGQTAAPAERKVCRRQIETGSRVKARTQCYTRAEWALIDDEQRDASTTLVERQRLRTLGN